MTLEVQITLPDGSSYNQPTGLYIDGQYVSSENGQMFDSIDPYTQKAICSISEGNKQDIDKAVDAARRALPKWKQVTPQEKGKLLSQLANLIERDADILAKIEAIDGGKAVKIAKEVDVAGCASCLRYYGGWADKTKGDTIDTDIGTLNMTLREPLGVCGLIIPWNFPLLMCGWKLGPALAAGNTVVLKPAELTPLSALYLGKLITEAGFPSGVVNIVPGFGKDAGAALASHPDVSKISFTGSTTVGRNILHASADSNLKKTTLELGGKSPVIVFESAKLDEVVEWANGGIFYNMGQNCCAGSRIYVQESIYEEFVSKFIARARQNTIGNPFETSTFLGPQISMSQHARILSLISSAVSEGAVVATGGSTPSELPSSWFIEPTILRDVTQEMSIMHTEVFGPVVAIAPFKSLDDALEKAHDTCYGLAAGIFTENIREAMAMAKALEAGSVWVNCYNVISHQIPFGGFGQSGNGKDLGEEAMNEFSRLKSVRIKI